MYSTQGANVKIYSSPAVYPAETISVYPSPSRSDTAKVPAVVASVSTNN